MEFEGKTVVVTGAAGGIGRAVVGRFAAAGATLVLSDRRTDDLENVRSELGADAGDVHCVAGDLMERRYCADLIAHAVDKTGRIDVLVNNAAIITRGNILETSDEDWFTTIGVNLSAVFFTCKAAIGHMTTHGGGAIVNVASTWGIYPGPGHPAYITSKGAVATLSRCLARDHARDGIRVNSVCPNEVNTPMLRTGFVKRGLDPERAIEQLNESVPLGRIAEPEDIADVIVFLASDASRYVAGATVEVTGAKAVY